MKINLSEVKQVPVGKLKPNEVNNLYFRLETGAYFNKLSADINKRGVLVPLVAKMDFTILAGHNRLLAAKAVGLKTVPVQFVIGKLTEDEENEFVIKDNLLRRHLNPTERDQLYRHLISDFDERVMVKAAKGISIDVDDLAAKTGLNPKTITYDITRNRRKKLKEINSKSKVLMPNEKEIENFRRAVTRMINVAIIEKAHTVDEFMNIISAGKSRLESIQAMPAIEIPKKLLRTKR